MSKGAEVVAIIPARGGSKRIPDKNTRDFCGEALVARAVKQAKAHPQITRVVVDTDSPDIAKAARKAGAEVLYLRPAELATDTAKVVDAILYLLGFLKKEENYVPEQIVILQTTSPLRRSEDIDRCFALMEKGGADTVLTLCPTHPRLYSLDEEQNIILMNGSEMQSTNMQEWRPAYILNGCFVYIVKTEAILREKRIITERTKGVICDKWRSVDLDTPEEWAVAELLFKHQKEIEANIKKL